ncbi:MAG: hypothetical protein KJ638_04650 [Chloroflexi bacterium]|nr:hypothetical protein [Chloroflexota bacterium]
MRTDIHLVLGFIPFKLHANIVYTLYRYVKGRSSTISGHYRYAGQSFQWLNWQRGHPSSAHPLRYISHYSAAHPPLLRYSPLPATRSSPRPTIRYNDGENTLLLLGENTLFPGLLR